MDFNIIQALGIADKRTVFHVGNTATHVYRQGDIVSTLDEHMYLIENIRTTSIVLRRLNWWGRLLLKFGWLV